MTEHPGTPAPTGPTPPAVSDEAPSSGPESDRSAAHRLRRHTLMITVLALCQIPIAAIRLALAGWEPSVDSGATTVRIRDVLSTRPPMTGMAAFPSMNEAQNYSFPGALHLYLLALPVRLLGTTWGVLVGMAIINTAASAAAIWLIRRRLGERWAILTAVFLASLLWTLGTGPLVFPTPMAIVVVPLFAFLVAAWATAEGDEAGLLVFVMLANYLFLSQLVLVVVVPVVAAVALARFVAVRVAERRRSATDSADRRRRRKWIVASAAFTVLVWIPPIIDQFTGAGNLGKVFNSLTSGHVRIDFYANLKPSFRGAVGVLTSVVAVPHWWLPPSFVHAPFDRRGGGTSFVVGAAWTVVVVALGLWGYLRARRRGDRTIVSMLAIAVSVWLAYLVTAWKDPDVLGYSQQYLMGLWPTSAFIWLAVTTAVASAVPDVRKRLRDLGLIAPRLAAAAICAIVAVAIAAPQRSPDILTPSESLANARAVRAAVTHADLRPGPVLVLSDLDGIRYVPSVILGLQDARIPIRVPNGMDAEQYGASRNQSVRRDAKVALTVSTAPSTDPAARLVATVPPSNVTPAQFNAYDAKMRAWIRSARRPVVPPNAKLVPALRSKYQAILNTVVAGSATERQQNLYSNLFLVALVAWRSGEHKPLVDPPGLTRAQVQAWLQIQWPRKNTVYLFESPVGR